MVRLTRTWPFPDLSLFYDMSSVVLMANFRLPKVATSCHETSRRWSSRIVLEMAQFPQRSSNSNNNNNNNNKSARDK